MFDFRFYALIFLRRLPLFLLVSGSVIALSIGAAIFLPPSYVSQVQVIVESPQIPDKLAESTVTVTPREQLQLFETRLLTRANLLDIAQRLKPFEDMSQMSPDAIVNAMKAQTTLTTSSSRDAITLMELSFEDYNPQMAAAVLNEYLTILLREDAEFRASRAGSTQEFFQQEVDRLSTALAAKSGAIVDFKNKNSDALPDSLTYRRQQQTSNEAKLAQMDRDISGLEEQRTRLVDVYNSTGQVSGTSATASPLARRMQTLQMQLSDAQAVYKADSPKVVMLRDRIAKLQTEMSASGVEQSDADPGGTMLNLQLAEIDSKIEALKAEYQRVSAQQAALTDTIARTPANAVALEGLQRDYDNIQSQYNTAIDRLSKASTGERIETLSRGQRVSVVEQPTVPTQPTKPNRKLIAAGGTFFGLLLGFALVFGIEFFNRTARRPADLVNSLGITPLTTIPNIRSAKQINRSRARKLGGAAAAMIATLALIYALYAYYAPLDQFAGLVLRG